MNENLLLQYNQGISKVKPIFKNGCIIYKNNNNLFDGTTIQDILFFINNLHNKYNRLNVPISFELGEITFKDKLTYIFLEIICFILIKNYRHKVYVNFKVNKIIVTNGISSSPLLLLGSGRKEHIEKFIKKYEFDIYHHHYRRVLTPEDMKNEKLSIIMDDSVYFLNFFDIDSQCIDEISEVIIELIGNVSEHTFSNCLIDIDIAPNYTKQDEEGTFYGINLVIVNFSECLFNSLIKERFSPKSSFDYERYKKVKVAYTIHKDYFGDNYTEDDFFNIVAFQHKISGNINKNITGGTGLTKLICSLEKRSDAHNCYLISGERALWFLHELLEYNQDNWIGFNKEKDFLHHPPDSDVVNYDMIFMPGTAYNLNFVMKRRY